MMIREPEILDFSRTILCWKRHVLGCITSVNSSWSLLIRQPQMIGSNRAHLRSECHSLDSIISILIRASPLTSSWSVLIREPEKLGSSRSVLNRGRHILVSVIPTLIRTSPVTTSWSLLIREPEMLGSSRSTRSPERHRLSSIIAIVMRYLTCDFQLSDTNSSIVDARFQSLHS
jgi:hypothetical protein